VREDTNLRGTEVIKSSAESSIIAVKNTGPNAPRRRRGA